MKTPEEMAEEYLDQDKVASAAINRDAEDLVKDAFIAGYHTAYNIAYECGFEEGLKAQKTLTDIQAKLKKTNENS